MLQRVLVACAVLLAFALSSSAQAGIPIPCTATHLLKAGDLMSVMDTSGQKMVFYYNVSGCSDGRWDGYRGADGKSANQTSIRPLHAEHVLAEVGEHQVGRDRRDLIKPHLAPFALDVVFLRITKAAMRLHRSLGGLPACF
jgi:hypothetical protein